MLSPFGSSTGLTSFTLSSPFWKKPISALHIPGFFLSSFTPFSPFVCYIYSNPLPYLVSVLLLRLLSSSFFLPTPKPMFLTEKSSSPLTFLLFFPSNNSVPSPSLAFDQALIVRLRFLLPIPNSPFSISLSWLSRAVDVLTFTLADAAALIADPSLSGSDRATVANHLDSGIALLDACNAVSAHIDRLVRGGSRKWRKGGSHRHQDL